MRHPDIKTSDQIAKHQHFTLLNLLDRLLDKGVVVKGEVMLSVADIDLIYLNLGVLLSSLKTLEEAASRDGPKAAKLNPWQTTIQEGPVDKPQEMRSEQISTQEEFLDEPLLEAEREDGTPVPFSEENSQSNSGHGGAIADIVSSAIDYSSEQFLGPKANIDPKNVEKGLTKLVLTLVELIRQLMEKQAIRRIESGQLNANEIEKVGNAFFLLNEKMEQLKKTFGLEDEDLNLDLGPLGELM